MRVNIEAERVRNRMTKEELAKKLGISLKTYYNWLDEENDISSKKLFEMSKMFGVTMEYLLESYQDASDERGGDGG